MIKVENHAQAALASALSIGATAFSVPTGFGAYFPELGAEDECYIMFGDDNVYEIVHVTERNGDDFVCDAIIKAWDAGADVQIVPCKEIHQGYLQKQMLGYYEKVQSATIVSGVLTIDLNDGNCFTVELTENITSIVIQNPKGSGLHHPFTLYTKQDSTGGRMVDFAGMHTSGGSAPTITSDASAKDAFTIATRDGGTTWEVSQFGTDVQVIS